MEDSEGTGRRAHAILHRLPAILNYPPRHASIRVIIIVLRGGGDLFARRGAALAPLDAEDRPPEVLLGDLDAGRLDELRAGGVELVAVRQDLAADQVAGECRLEPLELVLVQRDRRLFGGGVAA